MIKEKSITNYISVERFADIITVTDGPFEDISTLEHIQLTLRLGAIYKAS